jgi:hypothetical protein
MQKNKPNKTHPPDEFKKTLNRKELISEVIKKKTKDKSVLGENNQQEKEQSAMMNDGFRICQLLEKLPHLHWRKIERNCFLSSPD